MDNSHSKRNPVLQEEEEEEEEAIYFFNTLPKIDPIF